jgi:outer membrane protein TolC
VESVRLNDAKFEENILLYQGTVLRAAQEVEDAAVGFLKAKRQIPLLADSAKASRDAFALATEKYRKGAVPFALVMDAMEYRVRQDQRQAANRGESALQLIALYKAMGGGWELREGKAFVPEEVKDRMRERTDWWTFWGGQILEDEIRK